MNFTEHKFSKRFPPVTCAIFVVHEPQALNVTSDTGFDLRTVPARVHRGTAAAIILPDGRFWVGVTLCSPRDPFVKATGRAKAIGRAFVKYLASERHYQEYLEEELNANARLPVAEFAQGQIDVAPDAPQRLTACLRVEINKAKRLAMYQETAH